MSRIMLNNAEYTDMQKHIDLAKQYISEAIDDIWAVNFSNLYNNFITNGFLEDLYKDAESNFNLLFGLGTTIIGGGGAILSGTAAATGATAVTVASVSFTIPVVGWIIGAVILAILAIVGIVYMVQSASDVQFKKDARNIFEALLEECANGSQMNFHALENVETKIENIRLAMQNILLKISEFNTKYANLNESATSLGLKTELANDNTTILGINTTVSIDGQQIETSTSEAMNAFFTYSNTVIDGEIAADYLSREYGYDIKYSDIVKNANAFMTKTINSDLYSHEFIEALLPTYTPNIDKAYANVTGATKVSSDRIKSALNNNQSLGGDVALYGGLVGAALIGPLASPFDKNDTPKEPDKNAPSKTEPSGNNNGNNSNGNNGNGNNGNGNSNSNSNSNVTKPIDKDDEDDKKEDVKPVEDEKTEEPELPTNDVVINEIMDVEIPEQVELDLGEVDYDELARDNYEFNNSIDDILNHRNEIINELQTAYDTGDFTNVDLKLRSYGYDDAEVETILNDKFKSFKAMLEGDERLILAVDAAALAKADGVEDFVSSWSSKPNINDLSYDGPSELLSIRSEDQNICDLKASVDTAKENYTKVVEETNEVLKEVEDNKKVVDEIKAKYEKEYGEDTTKWTEEAAKEYNEAIDTYNESTQRANEQLETLEESKVSYDEAQTAFEIAKKEYYDKLVEEHNNSQTNDSSNQSDSSNENVGITDNNDSLGVNISETNSDVSGTDESNETVPGVIVSDDSLGF